MVSLLAVSLFATRAQRTFSSIVHVCRALEAYVDAHEGHWPSGWQELEPHLTDYPLARAQEDVIVEFEVDVTRLLNEPGHVFTVIRPQTICYQAYEKSLQAVVTAVRRHREPAAPPPPSPANPPA